MGDTLTRCKTCDTFQNYQGVNQLFKISQYYQNRLGDFQQILPQIPSYLEVNHARLVNDLRMRQQKFQDLIYPSQYLLNNSKIRWKRIIDIFPNQPFSKNQNNFQFEFINNDTQPSQIHNLQQMLIKLNKFPDLITKIFTNLQLSKQGFYVLYFCLNGNIIKRIAIVIDDYLPINIKGKYLFSSPKHGNGIWMLLIAKAWAKILNSYHHICTKTSNQFFSETTGVPIPDLYRPGDFLMSGKYYFQSNQSKYLKICRESPASMLFSICQSCLEQRQSPKEQLSKVFVIELMTENRSRSGFNYKLINLSTVTISNKLILFNSDNKSMFDLQNGKHILHIFNRSLYRKQCNMVIHARVPVTTHTRYQKQFKQSKMQMIKNQYNKINTSINIQQQYPGIDIKFCWIKHRGIFEFNNKQISLKTITISIKKTFYNDIIFEDYKQNKMTILLEPKKKQIAVIVRRQDKQYGLFYLINLDL